jgi:hypothetical protein
MELRIFA